MSEEIEENLVDDICGECGSAMRVPESLVGELRCEACAEALPFLGFYDKRKIAAKDAEITRLNAENADLVPRLADLRETVDGLMVDLARVRGQRDYLGPIAHERLEQQGGKEYANGCLSLVGLRIINGTVEEIES